MPTWPITLPQKPLLGNFSEERQRNVAAFQPNVGPAKMRRRSTAAGVSTSVVFQMSGEQIDTFDSFYETDLADGTLPFTWPHPRTGTLYSWMFASDKAPSKQHVTAEITRVSFGLLRLP